VRPAPYAPAELPLVQRRDRSVSDLVSDSVSDDGAAAGFAYGRDRRVTRGADLEALRREGRRVRTTHLDVRVAPGPAPARVGIIVPKHRHGSVERNLVKRRLRELARLRLLPVVPTGRVLLRARPEAYGATFAALARDVERAAREATRLTTVPEPGADAGAERVPDSPPPG
jgi:ribonuclease P protein component